MKKTLIGFVLLASVVSIKTAVDDDQQRFKFDANSEERRAMVGGINKIMKDITAINQKLEERNNANLEEMTKKIEDIEKSLVDVLRLSELDFLKLKYLLKNVISYK